MWDLLQEVKEKTKQRLASALILKNKFFEVFPFDFDELAESEGISPGEARERFRHLELNGPDDGNGIQITLYDDIATITLPSGWPAGRAKYALEEVWDYLKLLVGEAGYAVYDPQREALLNLRSDLDAVIAEYVAVSEVIDQALEDEVPAPWWKFW